MLALELALGRLVLLVALVWLSYIIATRLLAATEAKPAPQTVAAKPSSPKAAAGAVWRLVVRHSNLSELAVGSSISITGPLEVGRGARADLMLADPQVSRRHALLWLEGQSLVLQDAGSTNGTFVNGRRLEEPVELGPHDMVEIGPLTFEVMYE